MRINTTSEIKLGMTVYLVLALPQYGYGNIEKWMLLSEPYDLTSSSYTTPVCDSIMTSINNDDAGLPDYLRLSHGEWKVDNRSFTVDKEQMFLNDWGIDSHYNNHRVYTDLGEAMSYLETTLGAIGAERPSWSPVSVTHESTSAYDAAMKGIIR